MIQAFKLAIGVCTVVYTLLIYSWLTVLIIDSKEACFRQERFAITWPGPIALSINNIEQ